MIIGVYLIINAFCQITLHKYSGVYIHAVHKLYKLLKCLSKGKFIYCNKEPKYSTLLQITPTLLFHYKTTLLNDYRLLYCLSPNTGSRAYAFLLSENLNK